MNICLDFDGVLHDTTTVPPGGRLGRPIEGARDACWDLHRAGHKLFVHTARQHCIRIAGQDDAFRVPTAWLEQWLRYSFFPTMIVAGAIKPLCDLYLDDRGWRFTSWEDFQLDTGIFDGLPEVPQWTR